jgi:lipopolysaccharide/colanic/teichoic acid biosynthesis glycosyltransferase
VQRSTKRAIDVMASAVLLALLLPLLALIAGAILLTMGRPVCFRQSRSGRNGVRFILLKLRTMAEDFDTEGRPLDDGARLTRLGRWIRASSLDELPQLWNVLRGEMSLVGPRPLLPQYLGRYSQFQRRRLEVLPGITGWAQIHGRNAVAWEPRFQFDVWYVDHWSLPLDFRILARTLGSVLKREGINAADRSTMTEFQGDDVSPLKAR